MQLTKKNMAKENAVLKDSTIKNIQLAKELLAKGYYVNEISRGFTVDYLVVSVAPPQHQRQPT